MRSLIENIPNQIGKAVKTLKELDPSNHKESSKGFNPSGVLILGMGGSGIGGAIISSLLEKCSSIPVVSNSNYTIPAWVNSSTLVVACSYSGNTEETISSVEESAKRNSIIACISSGGKLTELSLSNNWPLVVLEGGHPPRSQFCSSFLSLSWTLMQFNIVSPEMYSDLAGTHESTQLSKQLIIEKAEVIADIIEGKNIFIYSDIAMSSIATRWRQQLNENSKLLVNTKCIPEMNHNELVGWDSGDENCVAVIFRTEEDHARNQARMTLSADIIQDKGADVVFVESGGANTMQRVMDLVFLGDFLSLILAERAGIDPFKINNINSLKDSLGQTN